MRIEAVAYDHPDVADLIEQVQQEYVVRYGGPDVTPLSASEFLPPHGVFLAGYRDGSPVATGGWRARDSDVVGLEDGDAEIKRMYVVPAARGLGYARAILGELERRAARAGRKRMVLETGLRQPEAIGLYESAGYREIPKFGVFADEPHSRCFAKELVDSTGW